MLIHPWDAAIGDTEWRNWLAGHDFGQLELELLRRSLSALPDKPIDQLVHQGYRLCLTDHEVNS